MISPNINLNRLIIYNDLYTINKIYNEYNYLVLRPYNGEKILLIACGNNRIDNGNLDNRHILK